MGIVSDGLFVGEAWIRGRELIIGTPVGYDLTDEHNCDANGCGSWHVLATFPLNDELKKMLDKVAHAQAARAVVHD